ncbi:MAG: TolC family protein, partial [Proteobacteria bacterium]|nr:TolC family protein [Pseudomonadota bacterium]
MAFSLVVTCASPGRRPGLFMKSIALMTLSLLLLPAYSGAEEKAQSNMLTLQTCIDKTLVTHPDIKKLHFQVEQKNAVITSNNAANLPQISVSAEYNPIKTFVMPQNGRFLTDDHDAWRAGIGLTQKIYDFGSNKGRIKASEFSKEIAALSLKETKRLLVYQVQTLYDTLLLQKAAMKAREEDIKTTEALYLQAKELVKNGLKTRAD